MLPHQKHQHIVLGSASPRRKALLKEAGFNFSILTADIDESFPSHLQAHEIPLYLSQQKAKHLLPNLNEKQLLITADTIVWLQNHALNKPANFTEAYSMLSELSGKTHEVYTAVCISNHNKQVDFFVKTTVQFKELNHEEISYYITTFQPYDKAGAYGAQDWIGLTAIENLNGSYFNVMGLPVKELYDALKTF